MKKVTQLLLTTSLVLSAQAMALSGSSGIIEKLQYKSSEQNVENAIEHITVYGQRPLIYFKNQVIKAENDFFNLFNQFADQDEFKIKCSRSSSSGTRIRSRVCEPAYITDLKYDIRFLSGGSLFNAPNIPVYLDRDFQRRARQKRVEHIAYMTRIADEHPELQDKLEDWAEARMSYAFKHYQRWGKYSHFSKLVKKDE